VQQALQKKLEELKKELADSITSGSETTTELLQAQEELEKQNADLLEQIEMISKERDSAKNKVEELSGKVEALGSNLNAMIDEKKALDKKLQSAAKQESKLKASETELSSLRSQINKLKLEQTKSTGLIEKLQAEKEASERNHGQRTALVGMLESQLSELNEKNTEATVKLETATYDLSQKEEEIQSLREELEKSRRALLEAQNARKQASESLSLAQKGADAKKTKLVDSLQREVQTLQQQMARKSAAAQRLIQEREAECIELRKANKILQQEVDKGSLSDRRIFELAEQQSNRESVAAVEIEMRDKLMKQLAEMLEARDGDLAAAEYAKQQVEKYIEELGRVKRREDVNLDYLKSIVVQFLSKPPGSSERQALLPVLATLLQFDANDYKTIEEGKNKLSWWGSVAPVMISAPAESPASGLGASAAPLLANSSEVSVSSVNRNTPTENGSRSRTSLQF
jgi:chromosome segregation ATPase